MDEREQNIEAWAAAVNGVLDAAESLGDCIREEVIFRANVRHEQKVLNDERKARPFRAVVGAVRTCESGVDIGLDDGSGDFSTWLTVSRESGLREPVVGDIVTVVPPRVTDVSPGRFVDKPPGKV